MPWASTDHLDAKPSSRFISDCLVFVGASEGTGKVFVTSSIQRFLKTKKEMRGFSTFFCYCGPVFLWWTKDTLCTPRLHISWLRSTCTFLRNPSLAGELCYPDFIIWGGIAGIHRYILVAEDRSLREIVRFNLPSAGKTVYIFVNFCPIIPVGGIGKITNSWCVFYAITTPPDLQDI